MERKADWLRDKKKSIGTDGNKTGGTTLRMRDYDFMRYPHAEKNLLSI